MTRIQLFQRELEKEALVTRKMLALVPAEKSDWKPHPKSMPLMNLSMHIAELPTWIGMVLNTDELDFMAGEYKPAVISTNAELLALFEKSLEDGRLQLANGKEEVLDKIWTLRSGDHIHSADPKADVIRMALSQIIHHRAQLGVYLRLLDIPIPGSYGPSADDTAF